MWRWREHESLRNVGCLQDLLSCFSEIWWNVIFWMAALHRSKHFTSPDVRDSDRSSSCHSRRCVCRRSVQPCSTIRKLPSVSWYTGAGECCPLLTKPSYLKVLVGGALPQRNQGRSLMAYSACFICKILFSTTSRLQVLHITLQIFQSSCNNFWAHLALSLFVSIF